MNYKLRGIATAARRLSAGLLLIGGLSGGHGFAATGDITTFVQGLSAPRGQVFDSDGNLFVAEFGGNRVTRIAPDGTTSLVANVGLPTDLAFDSSGTLHVASATGNSVVRINADGTTTDVVTNIDNDPYGLAFDPVGNMYVGGVATNRVYMVDAGGNVTTLANVQAPRDLFYDNVSGLLYISSQQGGIFTWNFNTSTLQSVAGGSSFGVTADGAGNVFFAGFANHLVNQITGSGVTAIAGTGGAGFSGDGGPATSAQLSFPEWISVFGSDVYVGDPRNNGRIRVIEGIASEPALINTFVSGLLGAAEHDFDSAGTLHIAEFGRSRVVRVEADGSLTPLANVVQPTGLAFDVAGSLFVLSANTNSISRVNTDGSITAVASNLDNTAYGLTIDDDGNMYFGGLATQKVYRVDTSGNVTDLFSFSNARDVHYDSVSGLLFVSGQQQGIWTYDLDTGAVSQLTPTIFEAPAATASPVGGSYGVVTDAEGNVFYAGFDGHVVYKVDASEVTNPARDINNVTVIAGTEKNPGSSGDGGLATSAQILFPAWVSVLGSDVYVGDRVNTSGIAGIRVIEGVAVAPVGEPDADGDGVSDGSDNCSAEPNADQADLDGDGSGDVCDADIDGDGVNNNEDAFPFDPDASADADNDGVADGTDLCPATLGVADANGCSDVQVDTDADSFCDPGAVSAGPSACTGVDNCPIVPNDQTDVNGDGFGDACVDPDIDIDPGSFGSNPLIDEGVSIGDGTVFGDNADIGADATIRNNVTAGDNVIIGANATIGQFAVMAEDVEVAADARLAAYTTIGRGSTIVGTVRQESVVGEQVLVGFSSIISRDVVIGNSVNLGEFTRVRAGASVGDSVDLQTGAVIAKDAIVGDSVSVGEGSKVRAGASVGNNVQIGPNVVIAKGVVIGDNVQIGLGCTPASSLDEPPCVRVAQGSSIAGDNVIGMNVRIRKNVVVPAGTCVADDTEVRANTTVDTLCQ